MAKNVVTSRADARRELAAACLTSLDTADQRCVAPCVPDRTPPSPLAHETVWMLRRAFASAAGTEVVSALSGLVGRLAAHREIIRESVLAWARLLDELTTAAQRSYGAGEGTGRHKKDAVKAALVHYARRLGFDLAGVPGFVEPFLYDAIADIAIEAIYRVSRHQPDWALQSGKRVRVKVVRKRMAGLFVWLSERLARFAWWMVLRQNPLVPEVEAALDRVTKQAPADREMLADSVRATIATLEWVGKHRAEVVALIDALTVAIRDAELLFADGQTKRTHVRELMFEFLLQEGIIGPSGIGRAFVEATIDIAIDAVVEIFNRRNVFTHAALPAPSEEAS